MPVPTPRDLVLARRAKRHGARYSLRIIWEARRARIPISLGFALVEQESNFRNVFGHDPGGLFPGQDVTAGRVKVLLTHVAGGGTSNGVGLTQLTWPPFIRKARDLGGAHKPQYQLRVAFEILGSYLKRYHPRAAYAKYNGTGPAAERYAGQLAVKAAKWRRILAG